MRLTGATIVLAILLAPGASAGSERDPEIEDAADGGRRSTDLLAAWFQTDDDGVRFSLKTADGSAPEDHVYWVSFRVEGRSVGAVVGFGNDGVLRGHLGALNGPAWGRGGFERIANNELRELREERGRPATWSAVVPWGAVPGLEEGARLSDLAAGTAFYDRASRQWQGAIDTATSDRVFVANASFFPILVPAWVLPAIVIGCTLGGMASGLAFARLRKPQPKATPIPVRSTAAPPRPGERFQRAPPRQ